MQMLKKMVLGGASVLMAVTLLMGCESSSHKSVRTYEYNDEPQQKRSESNKLDSEYKMQSEGEMKGPH